MNKEKFLKELEQLLADLPDDERNEAMEYYRCYFEDAGIENEKKVLSELGSPRQVACQLKEGLKEEGARGEYTENGYQFSEQKNVPEKWSDIISDKEKTDWKNDKKAWKTKRRYAKKEKKQKIHEMGRRTFGETAALFFPWLIALISVICAISVAIAAVCAAAGVIGAGAAVSFIMGLVLTVFGFTVSSSGLTMDGLGLVAIGLFCIAAGVLFLALLVFYCRKPLPSSIRAMAGAIRKVVGIIWKYK